MKTITDYKAITVTGDEQLNEAVTAHIKEGWQPNGTPAVTLVHPLQLAEDNLGTLIYTQVLVKYGE